MLAEKYFTKLKSSLSIPSKHRISGRCIGAIRVTAIWSTPRHPTINAVACFQLSIRDLTELSTRHSIFPRFCVWLFSLDRYVSHKALICIHLRRCVYKTPAQINHCLSMRIHVHCFLPNSTTASAADFMTNSGFHTWCKLACQWRRQHGECNIQQYWHCSLLLDFSVSSEICNRSTGEGERRPPLTYPEFSLSFLMCLCLSPRSAFLPSASLNPYLSRLSRSFLLSRFTTVRRPSTVTKTGAARRPFIVYEGCSYQCVRPRYCNYCKLPPHRSVKECSLPLINFVWRIRTHDRIFIHDMRFRGKK